MRNFAPHLSGEDDQDELSISVNCDLHVFAWMMNWIRLPSDPPRWTRAISCRY